MTNAVPAHVGSILTPSAMALAESQCELAGEKYTFTIKEGADGKNGRISVNYDGFIEDVGVGDMLLVDGGLLSLKIIKKDQKDVITEVVDGGMMGSR